MSKFASAPAPAPQASKISSQGLFQAREKYAFLVDTTTRPRRDTEPVDATVADKHFVSRREFAEMAYRHEFANWFRNQINEEYYGTEWVVLFDAFAEGRVLVEKTEMLLCHSPSR